MQLKIKRIHPKAILPHYQTAGAACFDLHAVVGGLDIENVYLALGNPLVISTGLEVEVPEGHVMLIYSRSGHGFSKDIRLSNCVGVIDSDYRGEVKVKLRADSDLGMSIANGDRIAQAMIVPIPKVELVEVLELSETDRGAGGFGSTGVASPYPIEASTDNGEAVGPVKFMVGVTPGKTESLVNRVNDEWITHTHTKDECPVSPNTRVHVKLVNGNTSESAAAIKASLFRWARKGQGDDIAAYRIVTPQQSDTPAAQ